jgi:hypothetical protein
MCQKCHELPIELLAQFAGKDSRARSRGVDVSIAENRLKYQARGAEFIASRRTGGPSLLLVAAMIAATLAGGIKAGSRPNSGDESTPNAITADATSSIPATGADLNPAMSAALESVAQRYRVAPEALQPIFAAAQQAARELDPLLIIAVIGIESGFNPFAQSVMGAQGLMQVIPRFHRDKLPPETPPTAFLDPVSNVHVGAQVLHEAIRRQGGLIEGLQYYAGAADDPERGYAARVIAEKQRLELAVRLRKPNTTTLGATPRQLAMAPREAPKKAD